MKALRKGAAVLVLLVAAAVLVASTSRRAMQRIVAWRDRAPHDAPWGVRSWNGSDLVRMGYLGGVARFADTEAHRYPAAGRGAQRINLYLYGDSYVKDLPDSAFYGLNSYHFMRRDYGDLLYRLDTTHRNILVLQLAERFIRDRLSHPDDFFAHVHREAPSGSEAGTPAPAAATPARRPATDGLRLPAFLEEDLFNPAINQNIEYNLFSYNFATPVRSFKAQLNALAFHRGSGDVVLSEKGDRLFLRSTLAPQGNESSFAPVPDADREYLVAQVNRLYEHYKGEGFDAVYLALVPNPVSVIQPEGYNRVLPGLQAAAADDRLQMPVIDVYDAYLASGHPAAFYLRGDTHWNDRGIRVWLGKVNAMLRAWEAAPDAAVRRRRW